MKKGNHFKRMIGNDLPFHCEGISTRFPFKYVRLSFDKDLEDYPSTAKASFPLSFATDISE